MAAVLSRRLNHSLSHLLRSGTHHPFLRPSFSHAHAHALPLSREHPYSSASSPGQTPDFTNFKHQEIEGPTVERDLSSLANETRQVLDSMMRTGDSLSKALASLALLQLAVGAWVSYASPAGAGQVPLLVTCAASSFPLALAFLLRRSLKSMLFFRKMEEQGRLQILTLALQVTKSFNIFFARTRGVSYACAAGLSAAFIFTLLARF